MSHSEEHTQYDVEYILAERDTNGTTFYLAKWKGLSDLSSTWQPKASFDVDEETWQKLLQGWQQRKLRVAEGHEKAFDVGDWEKRCNEHHEKEMADQRVFTGQSENHTFAGFLFDLDGTIIDTTEAITKHWQK